MRRPDVFGMGQAVNGDKTTTGATCIADPACRYFVYSRTPALRVGDKTTPCPVCGQTGVVLTGASTFTIGGKAAAVHDSIVQCGCPYGSNRVIAIAPLGHAQQNGEANNPLANNQKQPITLTIGLFFDGTNNNADNTLIRLTDQQTAAQFGQPGAPTRASYDGYYTNIHWLYMLYTVDQITTQHYQDKLYIEGPGTTTGQADALLGYALGHGETGVLAKVDKAIASIKKTIEFCINVNNLNMDKMEIAKIQFDLFGFSRGAAAARYFANLVRGPVIEIGNGLQASPAQASAGQAAPVDRHQQLMLAIQQAISGFTYHGKAAGEVRFLGLFDTVAALVDSQSGFSPHTAQTGAINIDLPEGIAQQVFHITARNECRYNFVLNSVQGYWPELALPGCHSDIGGGYNPQESEHYFLTKPHYRQTINDYPASNLQALTDEVTQQAAELHRVNNLQPILASGQLALVKWQVAPSVPLPGGERLTETAMAVAVKRQVSNDWAKVALRVMLDAASEQGAVFDVVQLVKEDLQLPSQLVPLASKALRMGREARAGYLAKPFNQAESAIIAPYLHCSANWGTVHYDQHQQVLQPPSLTDLTAFPNRPDKQWRRTVYTLSGKRREG